MLALGLGLGLIAGWVCILERRQKDLSARMDGIEAILYVHNFHMMGSPYSCGSTWCSSWTPNGECGEKPVCPDVAEYNDHFPWRLFPRRYKDGVYQTIPSVKAWRD